MVVFLYAPINVSYSAPNEDIYLHLAPFRSKCCQLDVPFLINWAFAQQLGVLIPQRDFRPTCCESLPKVNSLIPGTHGRGFRRASMPRHVRKSLLYLIIVIGTKWPHFCRRRHFIFNEKYGILIQFSLKFAPVCLVDVNGDKPLPESLMTQFTDAYNSGLILGLRPANERRRYSVTPSLIGWAQT